MDVIALRSHLDKIAQITSREWLDSLTPRGVAELEFHNRDRDANMVQQRKDTDTFERFYGNKKYYVATKRSRTYVEQWICKVAPGKVFLDYACGNGQHAILAAKNGAKLSIGLDISDVSIENAREAARKENLRDNIYFVQSNAEDTRLPSECIDSVICSGMLHHLNLSYAFPELRRILKVGGKVLGVEALDLNPAIKLYRALTPDMRTEWEKAHILGLSDLRFARRFFDVGDVKYWHVVGYLAGLVPAAFPVVDLGDRLLEKIPLLQWMAWQWTFELIRPPKS